MGVCHHFGSLSKFMVPESNERGNTNFGTGNRRIMNQFIRSSASPVPSAYPLDWIQDAAGSWIGLQAAAGGGDEYLGTI